MRSCIIPAGGGLCARGEALRTTMAALLAGPGPAPAATPAGGRVALPPALPLASRSICYLAFHSKWTTWPSSGPSVREVTVPSSVPRPKPSAAAAESTFGCA